MSYDEFQTDTGTLRKIVTDNFGDPSVDASYSCRVDPVFGFKRGFNREGEQITGKTTVLDDLPTLDLSHRKWRLDYNGNEYNVEDLTPVPEIGSNVPNHYEVMLS